MKQISLFDILDIADLPVGHWLTKEEVDLHLGEMIPYQDLEGLIGEKIIIELPRQSATDYKVVVITSYHKEYDEAAGWRAVPETIAKELYGRCGDRVGYSDHRSRKENSWVSESFCRNGRYDGGLYPGCMFAIKWRSPVTARKKAEKASPKFPF